MVREGVEEWDELVRRHLAAGTVDEALTAARDAGDWKLVAEVIETGWPQLFTRNLDELRVAFASLPPEAFADYPAARAVREMCFPVAPAVPGKPSAVLPDSQDELVALARQPQPDQVVNAALAAMIAMRLREDWDGAREQGIRLADLLEHAQAMSFDAVAPRIPSVEFQIGMSFLMAADTPRALRHMHRAFSTADLDAHGYIARDSAAKIALIHAVRGDVVQAATWLQTSDEAPLPDVSFAYSIESSRLTARALVAAATLDREEAAAARVDMAEGLIEEELWALRLHALARLDLFLGDVHGMQQMLEETNQALPYAPQPTPLLHDLLLSDSVDLMMAAGAGSRAQAALDRSTTNTPFLDVCRGRVALLAGETETALRRAEASLTGTLRGARFEIEALLLAAVALNRLGRRVDAVEIMHRAVARITSSGLIAGFATLPPDDLAELANEVGYEIPPGISSYYPEELSIVELTARERTVLDHLHAGRSLRAIANADFVSVNTVKSQARSLYRKLGAGSRDEALMRAQAEGLI